MLVSNRPVEPPSCLRREVSLSARRGARVVTRCAASSSRRERSGSFLTFGTALAGTAVSSPSFAEAADAQEVEEPTPLRYRSVFVSDFHLGTAGCQAEELLGFLRAVSCESLYLVGDIVDGWELSSGRVFWPQAHSDVLQKLLKRARKGCRIVYCPGNHDEALRDFIQDREMDIGENVIVCSEALHTTADGRRLLVMHGDRCDNMPHIRDDFSYSIKSLIYRMFQAFNRTIKFARRVLRLPYWSLASTVNANVGAAAKLIKNYEEALAGEARYQDVDGVVCGHIHHPALRTIDGVLYANTGDWVDSCSAIVEGFDGRLEVLRWIDVKGSLEQSSGKGGKKFKEPKSAIIQELLESEAKA